MSNSDFIISNLSGRPYRLSDCVRVVDPKQHTLYVKHNVFPVDMYSSKDRKDDSKDIVVYVYSRADSQECYAKWLDRTLE